MKIRIKNNTIRLRLTRTEVEVLNEVKKIQGQTRFLNNTLHYGIIVQSNLAEGARENDSALPRLESSEEGIHIWIDLLESSMKEWSQSENIGIYVKGNENFSNISIEKDFQCLVPREGEEEGDHYPHPKA